jgi:hypothetical protein
VLNFDWLAWVPLSAARGVFLVLFVLIGLLVSRVPAKVIFEGVDRPRWWHDLRLWAWFVLGVIFLTYVVF